MKRVVIITFATGAALTAALAGCSGTNAGGQKVSTSGHAKVMVDGQDQHVTGPVTCQQAAGSLQIGIGQPGAPNTVAVQATDAKPPVARQISLGTVNGVTLVYQEGSPGASAQGSKDGDSYKFSGTATGIDKTNPMAGMVSKPFEVDVTCP